MGDESGCDSLHAMLSGTFGEMYMCDLDWGRQHWSECDRCQGSLPEASNHLKFIEGELLRRIRVNIEQLRHRYCSSEQDLLARHDGSSLLPPSNTVNFLEPANVAASTMTFTLEPTLGGLDENTQRLLLLAEAGRAVQAQLQVMNDNWGLDYFHLLHASSEYSSTKCAPFIAALPIDVQLFVSQSILAMDSIEGCEPEVVTQMGSKLYMLVVNAAPEFCRLFSDCRGPVSHANNEVLPVDRNRLLRLCDNLEHWEDVADSLKAGQMEILRRWEQVGTRASDMEPSLKEGLGFLYAKLSENTRRSLQLGEYYYCHNQEPDDYSHAIVYFHRAYEAEFRRKLLVPLEARFQKERINNYGEERLKLMVGGRLNRTLTVGQALRFLNKDPVSKFVAELGIDANKLQSGTSELNITRNQAVHGSSHTREDADRVRGLLLGNPSILAHLFKNEVV